MRSIIDLADNLGLRVVAEGVERQVEAELLVSAGCDEAQGFAISQPIAAEELVAWLRRAGEAQRSDGPMGWVGSLN